MTDDDAGASPAGEGRRSSFPGDAGTPLTAGAEVSGTADAGTPLTAAAEVPRTGAGMPGAADIGGAGPAAADGAVPGRRAAILGSVAAGVAGGVFGTLLHGQLLSVGGTQLQVGAVGALILAGSLFLYCGLWAKNVIMTALAGGVAYGVVALLSSASSKTLILTGSSEAAPAVAVAGNVWLFGVLVVTLVAVALGAVVLRRSSRR